MPAVLETPRQTRRIGLNYCLGREALGDLMLALRLRLQCDAAIKSVRTGAAEHAALIKTTL